MRPLLAAVTSMIPTLMEALTLAKTSSRYKLASAGIECLPERLVAQRLWLIHEHTYPQNYPYQCMGRCDFTIRLGRI
jgi:hypothetical protein